MKNLQMAEGVDQATFASEDFVVNFVGEAVPRSAVGEKFLNLQVFIDALSWQVELRPYFTLLVPLQTIDLRSPIKALTSPCRRCSCPESKLKVGCRSVCGEYNQSFYATNKAKCVLSRTPTLPIHLLCHAPKNRSPGRVPNFPQGRVESFQAPSNRFSMHSLYTCPIFREGYNLRRGEHTHALYA